MTPEGSSQLQVIRNWAAEGNVLANDEGAFLLELIDGLGQTLKQERQISRDLQEECRGLERELRALQAEADNLQAQYNDLNDVAYYQGGCSCES